MALIKPLLWMALFVLVAAGCGAPAHVQAPVSRHAYVLRPGDSTSVHVAMAGVWWDDEAPQAIAYVWPDGLCDVVVGGFQFWPNGIGGQVGGVDCAAVYGGSWRDSSYSGALAFSYTPPDAGIAHGACSLSWSTTDSLPDSVYADAFYGPVSVVRLAATLGTSGGPWVPQERSVPLIRLVRVPDVDLPAAVAMLEQATAPLRAAGQGGKQ